MAREMGSPDQRPSWHSAYVETGEPASPLLRAFERVIVAERQRILDLVTPWALKCQDAAYSVIDESRRPAEYADEVLAALEDIAKGIEK